MNPIIVVTNSGTKWSGSDGRVAEGVVRLEGPIQKWNFISDHWTDTDMATLTIPLSNIDRIEART